MDRMLKRPAVKGLSSTFSLPTVIRPLCYRLDWPEASGRGIRAGSPQKSAPTSLSSVRVRGIVSAPGYS